MVAGSPSRCVAARSTARVGVVDGTAGRVARAGVHWGVFLGLAVTVVVLDQLAKSWLVANVAQGEVREVVGDSIRLVYHQNTGALFGLFRDQAVLFGLISIGVIGLIVAYHARTGRSLYMSVALGLLLGGAIGNLIDRLRLGYVVDFVDIGIGDLRFYTFNLADSAISTAIVLLVAIAVIPGLARLADGATDG
jgi:signal peptidase II